MANTSIKGQQLNRLLSLLKLDFFVLSLNFELGFVRSSRNQAEVIVLSYKIYLFFMLLLKCPSIKYIIKEGLINQSSTEDDLTILEQQHAESNLSSPITTVTQVRKRHSSDVPTIVKIDIKNEIQYPTDWQFDMHMRCPGFHIKLEFLRKFSSKFVHQRENFSVNRAKTRSNANLSSTPSEPCNQHIS